MRKGTGTYHMKDVWEWYSYKLLAANPQWCGVNKDKITNYYIYAKYVDENGKRRVDEVLSYKVFMNTIKTFFDIAKDCVVYEGTALKLLGRLGSIAARRVERDHSKKVINYERTKQQPKVWSEMSNQKNSALDPDRWRTLFIVGISQLMLVLDSSIMNIALPHAKHDLNISDANQQWVVTAYTLAFGSLLLLGGRIGDFVGRKKVLIYSLIGFAGASAFGGIASTQGELYAARAFQGLFGAALAPAALAIISVVFTEPKERDRKSTRLNSSHIPLSRMPSSA